jgi:hypothetical protein
MGNRANGRGIPVSVKDLAAFWPENNAGDHFEVTARMTSA